MTSNKINLKALLQIAPRRSHAFLAILLIAGVIFLLIGCLFLWNAKPHAEIPFIIGSVLISLSVVGWLLSQKDIDWIGSLPTTITNEAGISVTTDTRALVSSSAALQLSQLFSLLAIRRDLPAPSGLVDSKLQPISGTEKIAQEKVEVANHESEQLLIQAILALTKRRQEKLDTDNLPATATLPDEVLEPQNIQPSARKSPSQDGSI